MSEAHPERLRRGRAAYRAAAPLQRVVAFASSAPGPCPPPPAPHACTTPCRDAAPCAPDDSFAPPTPPNNPSRRQGAWKLRAARHSLAAHAGKTRPFLSLSTRPACVRATHRPLAPPQGSAPYLPHRWRAAYSAPAQPLCSAPSAARARPAAAATPPRRAPLRAKGRHASPPLCAEAPARGGGRGVYGRGAARAHELRCSTPYCHAKTFVVEWLVGTIARSRPRWGLSTRTAACAEGTKMLLRCYTRCQLRTATNRVDARHMALTMILGRVEKCKGRQAATATSRLTRASPGVSPVASPAPSSAAAAAAPSLLRSAAAPIAWPRMADVMVKSTE